jgi:hypothetical protein
MRLIPFAEQAWQLGDVARYAACLILGEQLGPRLRNARYYRAGYASHGTKQ